MRVSTMYGVTKRVTSRTGAKILKNPRSGTCRREAACPLLRPPYASRRVIDEAAWESGVSAQSRGQRTVRGRKQEVLFQMSGEGAENRVWPALLIAGILQFLVEAFAGHSNSANGSCGAVADT